MRKIEPLGNRVLVKVAEHENTTASGLVLPETAQEKPQEGIVEAVGNVEEMLVKLKVGDRILFAKYSGVEIKEDGQTYLVLNEDDVIARVLD
ncbi:MAG: co-chaperone GroES [Chloroflexi bacterium]|nr:co-chaperone GroES [Chloroflexota bacterium]